MKSPGIPSRMGRQTWAQNKLLSDWIRSKAGPRPA